MIIMKSTVTTVSKRSHPHRTFRLFHYLTTTESYENTTHIIRRSLIILKQSRLLRYLHRQTQIIIRVEKITEEKTYTQVYMYSDSPTDQYQTFRRRQTYTSWFRYYTHYTVVNTMHQELRMRRVIFFINPVTCRCGSLGLEHR